MNRREFLLAGGTLAFSGLAPRTFGAASPEQLPPSPRRLPRWRGFNLTEKCVHRPGGNPPFQETDFALVAEWGFDFARLPLSYLCWTAPDD